MGWKGILGARGQRRFVGVEDLKDHLEGVGLVGGLAEVLHCLFELRDYLEFLHLQADPALV